MYTTIKQLKAKLSLLIICLMVSFTMTAQAQAACGGINQKACPIFKKGPVCKSWLTNVRGICRPCGGLNQRACAITKKGKACKNGLKWKLGKCVKKQKKQSVKTKLLKDAKQQARKFKPMIRTISNTLKRVGNKRMIKRLKAALKSKDPNQIRRVIQDMQTRPVKIALQRAGFRTLSVGIQSSLAVAGGYGRETGLAQTVSGRGPVKLYVSKTYFGGIIAGVGNDLVMSAVTDNPNNIDGSLWAAIGNFDVGSGVGVVIWYDKRTFLIKGISVGIGIGSVGAGGAVGHGTTHLCPSRACNKVF